MGRDTTAGKRMAAKRSREKAAGFRRLNVAIKPEVLDRLTWLMTQHNCTSQAGVIELLVMGKSFASVSDTAEMIRNDVTKEVAKRALKAPSEKEHSLAQNRISRAQAPDDKAVVVMFQDKTPHTQMALFES